MLDTLDLVALSRQGKQYQYRARQRQLRALVACVIIFVVYLLIRVDAKSLGSLIVLKNNTWQNVSVSFKGIPYQVKISSNGTIWVWATYYEQLASYRNGNWTVYDPNDFAPNQARIASFAVDGDNVWVVVGRAIAHWNGSTWQTFPAIFKETSPASIVAGNFGVFAMNASEELAHFDGKQWIVDSAQNLLPDFSHYLGYPAFAQANGEAWFVWDPIWHFTATGWSLVANSGGAYNVLGTVQNQIYFNTNYGMSSVDTRTTALANDIPNPTFGQVHLPVESVVAQGSSLLAGTSSGLFMFDGKSWARSTPQPSLFGNNNSLAIDNQGNLWGAVLASELNDDTITANYPLRTTISGFVPLLMILSAILLWVLPRSREGVTRLQLQRGRLTQLIPDLQKYNSASTDIAKTYRQNLRLYFVVVFASSILIFSGVPLPIVAVPSLLIFYYLRLRPVIVKLRDRSIDAKTRDYLQRNIIASILISTFFVVLFIGLLYLSYLLFSSVIDDTILVWIGAFVLAAVSTSLISVLVLSAPIRSIYRGALAAGDYPKSLEQSQVWRKRLPRYPTFSFGHGFILLLAGRPTEAETVWRELLSAIQNDAVNIQANSLVHFAEILFQQSRFDEALPLLTAAMQMVPESGFYYRELIWYYQLQHLAPERALELSTYMLQFSHKPRLTLVLNGYYWSITLAMRALALANVRRYPEAKLRIEQAFQEANPRFKPGLAHIYFISGEINWQQSERNTAINDLNQAIALDPAGISGQRARKLLETIG